RLRSGQESPDTLGSAARGSSETVASERRRPLFEPPAGGRPGCQAIADSASPAVSLRPDRLAQLLDDVVDLGLGLAGAEGEGEAGVAGALGDGEVAALVAEALDVERLKVDRREVGAGRHAGGGEAAQHAVAAHPRGEADDVDEPAHGRARRDERRLDALDLAQPFGVEASHALAPG